MAFLSWPIAKVHNGHWSKVVYDRNGELLRVWMADDEQFRFEPKAKVLSKKYLEALKAFEDKRFDYHFGIDPISIVRATLSNLQARKIVSGGSTITMQLARLKDPKKRTLSSKIKEALFALRLEWQWTKKEILTAYAAEVPMGGNVVGVESASWALFNKSSIDLTWAEAALFAVIPNAPSFINLKKSRETLKKKRDVLLKDMLRQKIIEEQTYQLSLLEELPEYYNGKKLYNQRAHHFSEWVKSNSEKNEIVTTLDLKTQNILKSQVSFHLKELNDYGIKNLSVLITDTKSGEILAYEGSGDFYNKNSLGQNDGVQAPRSTGSTLKPFLYALAIDEGPWMKETKVLDVPTWYGSFSPQNFTKDYSGITSISRSLITSLNVPAVRMLNHYGVDRFYFFLKTVGFKKMFRHHSDYGLSLILGGAESTLFELTALYRSLINDGNYSTLTYDLNRSLVEKEVFSKETASQIAEVLRYVTRPRSEINFGEVIGSKRVSWKTGTSYGAKDGWAIGSSPEYTIGVWVGNFEGYGNEEISGVKSAAPLMFSLFNQLDYSIDKNEEYSQKLDSLNFEKVELCKQTGYRAGPNCEGHYESEVVSNQTYAKLCPYHKTIVVNGDRKRVNSKCWNEQDTTRIQPLIWPINVRRILSKNGIKVQAPYPWSTTCESVKKSDEFKVIYPLSRGRVFLPKDWDGKREMMVAEVIAEENDTLFWYINGDYYKKTIGSSKEPLSLESGTHELLIQNQNNLLKKVKFKVFKGEKN